MGIDKAQALNNRLNWTTHLRPMAFGAFIADFLAPERRTILETDAGLKFYADPLSNFGETLLHTHQYEAETEQILREHLSEHDNFLDVGANEGYFSVFAASIVGPQGYVAAVEPQSRLSEIIRINLALNGMDGEIFHGALGGAKGDSCRLYLSPSLNTGYSNFLDGARFSHRAETAQFIDPMEILGQRDSFALVKVDVEGFEDEVVKSLLPIIEQGKIRGLLLDYHAEVLRARKIDPVAIERSILEAGMSLDGNPTQYAGFRVYLRA
jgi:FkbM family methyltransferase